MAALQKYEKQYRIKEFRTVLHPQTTEKDPPNNYILESKAYFDWLFPNPIRQHQNVKSPAQTAAQLL